jgi:hypothetical protein
MGKDGALEFVDNALRVAKSRNNGRADDMAGWKEFTPHEREMVDAMLASPCHVIVTMRVKTAYEEQVNERTGRKQRVKVGLAPVQRAGLEYEFDLVGAMDEDNTLIIDKTRVVYADGSSPYAGKAFPRPGEKEFQAFVEWLKGAPAERKSAPKPSAPADKPPFQASDDDLPTVMGGTHTPGPNPIEQRKAAAAAPPPAPASDKPWTTFKGMLACFEDAKAALGPYEKVYYAELAKYHVEHANKFKSTADALACYAGLQERIAEYKRMVAESGQEGAAA